MTAEKLENKKPTKKTNKKKQAEPNTRMYMYWATRFET